MSMFKKDARRPKVMCGPSRTKQEFRKMCDVNNIVARFLKTGEWENVARARGAFVDCTRYPDFKSAMEGVVRATEAFNSLPAVLRERFHNDVRELVEFVGDSSNREEAVKLGLVEPKPEQKEPAKPAVEPKA